MEKFYIIVGLVAIIGIGALIVINKKMKEGFGNYKLKVYGITLVSLFVVILAISSIESTNSSPTYGILGAIVGYLFGLKKE
tara:strand:+ start:1350 stop:1592 length:243 start_codon:yes stop_codon:yes gene_type:complete